MGYSLTAIRAIGEYPIYPGHPLMIALFIFRSYPSASKALAPTQHNTYDALGCCEVPGAGDACHTACRMVKMIRDGDLSIEDAPEWANEAWKRFVNGPNFGNHQQPGLEQAARFREKFLEMANEWDWI
jgi:hypothetical protein